MQHEREKVEDIVVVSQKSEHCLNQRQLAEYRDFRRNLIKWMRHRGKDPEKAKGYAHATARQRAYKPRPILPLGLGPRRRLHPPGDDGPRQRVQ